MKAWIFTKNNTFLKDNPLLKTGKRTVNENDLGLANSKLLASRRIIDALELATGPVICRVQCEDTICQYGDRLTCLKQTVLWYYDATKILRKFARLCALDVVDTWEAPDIIVKYLKAGDDKLRYRAWSSWMATTSSKTPWVRYKMCAKHAARDTFNDSWETSRSCFHHACDSINIQNNSQNLNCAYKDQQNKRLTKMIMRGRS